MSARGLAVMWLVAAGCSGSSAVDAGPVDAGPVDAGPVDAGPIDAGPIDAGAAVANGTLGAFSALPVLPVPRANHCSTTAHGFLIVAGGNHAVSGGFAALDDVQVAALLADGGIGAWQLGGSLPSAVSECSLTADGDVLYLVDGIFDDAGLSGAVLSATIDASGAVSAWTGVGTLPGDRRNISGEAWVQAGTLRVAHSNVWDDGGGDVELLSAPASAPVASAWTGVELNPSFIGRPEWASDGVSVFTMGGYDSTTTALSSVLVEDIATGATSSTTALPVATTYGRAVAVDGFVFVVGGRDEVLGAPGTHSVFSAPIVSGGGLGAWTLQTLLPDQRTNESIAVGGDFLYVTGGAANGPGDDAVYAAQIRFGP